MSSERRIETDEEELEYRTKHFHDIRAVKDRQIACASCGNQLNIETNKILCHPLVGLLQCETCCSRFKYTDTNESLNYCYICGDSKKLYVCSDENCDSAFCKKCIKRNVSLSLLDAESDNWKCFICNPKPLWELRGVCAAVIDTKKGNKKIIKRRILPSQKERIKKAKRVQKSLRAVCDAEDDDSNIEGRPYYAAFMRRTYSKNPVEVILDSSNTSESEEESQRKAGINSKAKLMKPSSRESSSSSRASTLKLANGKRASKINKICNDSDSNEDSTTLADKTTTKSKRIQSFGKEKLKSKRTRSTNSSDDSNDKSSSSVSEASDTSKSRSTRYTMRHNKKKNAGSYNTKAKSQTKKYIDSTSESEAKNIDRKQNRRRNVVRSSNEEQKSDKPSSSNHLLHEIDGSDSSSKDFQKEKLFHSKHSVMRRLQNLSEDYTKTPNEEDSKNRNNKNEKIDIEQSSLNFNRAKEILNECKIICSNFQKYIEAIEQLYGTEDEEKLLEKSTHKIVKLTTTLDKKQKDLMTFHRLWSESSKKRRNAMKNLQKIMNDKRLLKEPSVLVERIVVDEDKLRKSGNEQNSKEVSECDSEEIFSADEMKSSRKVPTTRDTVDTPITENNRSCSDSKTDDEDGTPPMNQSKDSVESNADLQDSPAVSPVLGVSKEKKTCAEESNKKSIPKCVDSADNEAPLVDEDIDLKVNQVGLCGTDDICDNEEAEREKSPSSTTSRQATLRKDERDNTGGTNKDMIDESMDLFDSSFDILENMEDNEQIDEQEADAVTNRDQVESSYKIKSSNDIDARETSLNDETDRTTHDDDDKTLSEKDSLYLTPLSHDNEEEKDNREKVEPATNSEKAVDGLNVSKEVDVASSKTNDDTESLVDAEALMRKVMLDSDFDDDALLSPDANAIKQIAASIENDIDSKRNEEAKNDNSDVDSRSSTVILHAFKEKKSTAKDTVEAEAETKSKVENSDRKSHGENSHDETSSSSSDENEVVDKEEEDAKKALLESDDSVVSPLDEKTESLDVSPAAVANAKAKKELLASSNSESSSSEPLEKAPKSNDRKNVKRDRDPESDCSMISAVKKRRLKLNQNYYYINDKKLKMPCEVRVMRLNKRILKRYSHALQKSREYLEHKELQSLVNLDKLEKRHSKNTKKDSDESTDDNDALSNIKRLNRGKGKQTIEEVEEESLMDHLKKIENDDPSIIQSDSNSDEPVRRVTNADPMPVSNEDLISEANRVAKENLLNSSSDAEEAVALDSDDSINNDDENAKTGDEKKTKKKSEEKTTKEDEGKKEKEKGGQSNWRKNKLLTKKFSDSDSDAEKEKWDKKQEKLLKEEKNNSDSENEEKHRKAKKKSRRRIIDSDSDIKLSGCDSDFDNSSEASDAKQNLSDSSSRKKEKEKRKRRRRGDSVSTDTDSLIEEKKPKPKRKRIKKMSSDSDSDVVITSQGTPSKSGRKNIRKVLKDKQVADDTKQAAKEEEERLKRIAERQALYNEMYEMRLAGEEKVEKLVLDFDTETKEELVSVHEDLVKRLKPHQAQGIKFMWDACFESLERLKTTSGSGCIIAHCMGLGKTLQVIALTHTLLTHDATDVKTVLIVCPLSTVLNWVNEYKTWLKDLDDDVNVYELTKAKKNFERRYQLQRWQKTGGVLIMGYEMFRNLAGVNKNIRKAMKEAILECLVDPGADLVVCDEGHLLKNEDTALSKCMRTVKTMRRIVLTGTPLQNNLIEYHCMVQFVKPNLLGTKKEFLNRFVNPITNGQFDDSTAYDVKLMKKRAHVLHKMLEGSVQRFDYSVLTPFLPPKQEYVMFVRLTDTQIKMYQYYLDNLSRRFNSGGALFADFQSLQRVWTHPIVLRLNAEKVEKANEKKFTSDSEGSLKDFINDNSTGSDSSSHDSSSDSDIQTIDEQKENVPRRKTRNNPGDPEEEPEPEPKEDVQEAEWWAQFVQPEHFEDIRESAKLLLLFGILKESEQIGDKVLVFSQSLYSLTLIEEFLRRIDDETQKDTLLDTLDNHTGSWSLGLDYFRLDGQTSPENRSAWCRIFNRPTNTRARLFLISTRAGGLGINLTAANRVIIFDASWNPSHDVQSIFRIYRFGQKKPCYVYRFLAAGTMEEKIYNRQVTKLSLSCRVVDEQQIERHYSNHDLNELYMFEPYNKEKPTLNLPKDRLLAEIFLKYKDFVENYHEHDSLLENKAEEELDEEERKQAWLEYEEEKKGKPTAAMSMSAYQNMLLQQYNMTNPEQAGMMSPNMSLQLEYENLQQLIRKDGNLGHNGVLQFPNATLEQQKIMTNRALMEMYNYWERQAVLQPARNPVSLPSFQPRLAVPHATTNSNVHQMSQLNQLLMGQTRNYGNVNQSLPRVPNPFAHQTIPVNNIGKPDDDIIAARPVTSNTSVSNVQVAAQSTTMSKNQEE